MEIEYHNQIQHATPEIYLRKFKTPHEIISNVHGKYHDNDLERLNRVLLLSYSEADDKTKEKVLDYLRQIVLNWIQNSVGKVSSRCGLEIFGSYQLGANSFDSDIDAVCVVPTEMSRETDFFGDLVAYLEKNPNAEQVFPIPKAQVPLIKIKFHGVHFDILMSQIDRNILYMPFDKFFGGKELDNIPDTYLKSINGCRVAYYLKNNIKNYSQFQAALKALKMWAKNRGIYSQIFCYLGGISFTILLAKIYQLYPNYSCLKLLYRFFFIYSRWVWDIPVLLYNLPFLYDKIGDPSEVYIMTPVLPSMNAAHCVSKSTLKITRREFRYASRTIETIVQSNKPWSELFRPYKFFYRSKFFLYLSVMAKNNKDFMNWKGHIYSRFRKLIKLLYNAYNATIIEIRPCPKYFTYKNPNYSFCSKYYFSVSCRKYNIDDDAKYIDFSQSIRNFLQMLYAQYPEIDKLPYYINIGLGFVGRYTIPTEFINNDTHYAFE